MYVPDEYRIPEENEMFIVSQDHGRYTVLVTKNYRSGLLTTYVFDREDIVWFESYEDSEGEKHMKPIEDEGKALGLSRLYKKTIQQEK